MINDTDKLLVVIINHENNQNAILLKKQFSDHCNTILMDSGSEMTKEEVLEFDEIFENIYYNGLLNEANNHLSTSKKFNYLLLITSDVQVENASRLIERCLECLSDSKNGLYAPTVKDSAHSHMETKRSSGFRKVTFVEGFCFGVKREILSQVCPIDLNINRIGHGVDMFMGYLALIRSKWSIADDHIVVVHPRGSGYNDKEARRQRDQWMETKSLKAQIFHNLVSIDIFKNKLGLILCLAFVRCFELLKD